MPENHDIPERNLPGHGRETPTVEKPINGPRRRAFPAFVVTVAFIALLAILYLAGMAFLPSRG